MIEKELILRRVISDLKGFLNGEWTGTEGFVYIIEALEKVLE